MNNNLNPKNAIEKHIINDPQKSPEEKRKLIEFFRSLKLNILIVGATGAGKSSTINALFNIEKAKVGKSADPETIDIEKYDLNNGLILWDSPGLGDGKKEDELHKLKIKHKLTEKTDDGSYLIDLVLVILDASTRDLGTSYDLINNAVIPYLGNTPSSRIIVAINQADRAMKGTQGWNYEAHCPTPIGEDFLEKKVFSISKRIKESTNVDITPIYYSAGYKDELEYHPPYNLLKLLYLVIEASPEEKRAVFRETLSPEKENWKYNDHKKDYGKQTRNNLSFDTIVKVGMSILGAIFGFFG